MRVVSVPHTGTHFIKKLLSRYGFAVEMCHYADHNEDLSGMIISPIRDPWMCYITHQSRGRGIDLYHKSWKRFNEFYELNQNLHIIPIDVPEKREQALNRLSGTLGKELETNWKPVSANKRIPVDPIDLSDIYDLPVVKQFYPQPSYTYPQEDNMEDPVVRRLNKGYDPDKLQELYGLSDQEMLKKLSQVEGPRLVQKPKKRGRPRKQKAGNTN